MRLKLLRISSSDLNPPDKGMPDDPTDCDVELEIELCPEGHEHDSEYFCLYVATPPALSRRAPGFLQPTLLLNEFRWSEIENRIKKLLQYSEDSRNWDAALVKMGGHLQPYRSW